MQTPPSVFLGGLWKRAPVLSKCENGMPVEDCNGGELLPDINALLDHKAFLTKRAMVETHGQCAGRPA